MLGVIGRLGIKERSGGQRCSLASPPPTLDSPRLVLCSSLPPVVHRDLHHSNPICEALPKKCGSLHPVAIQCTLNTGWVDRTTLARVETTFEVYRASVPCTHLTSRVPLSKVCSTHPPIHDQQLVYGSRLVIRQNKRLLSLRFSAWPGQEVVLC